MPAPVKLETVQPLTSSSAAFCSRIPYVPPSALIAMFCSTTLIPAPLIVTPTVFAGVMTEIPAYTPAGAMSETDCVIVTGP